MHLTVPMRNKMAAQYLLYSISRRLNAISKVFAKSRILRLQTCGAILKGYADKSGSSHPFGIRFRNQQTKRYENRVKHPENRSTKLIRTIALFPWPDPKIIRRNIANRSCGSGYGNVTHFRVRRFRRRLQVTPIRAVPRLQVSLILIGR